MLPVVARFLLRLANDQVQQFTRYVDHFTYGNAVKVLRYQMLLTGSLISASLGEEWSGFGSTMFVQPLTQAWETVLQPSAASLNDKWSRSVVANWHTAFDGRFPFAVSKSDASLPMLAEFIRKDSGRIERFLTTELSGVLHKEGSQWVPDRVNSQGLTFNPAFLRARRSLNTARQAPISGSKSAGMMRLTALRN
jgi:type VI protein secretion system component VasK